MDFKEIVEFIFIYKNKYNDVTDEQKIGFFFIFNRFMSKHYPKQAQMFNNKNIDKVIAMNIWFLFLKKESRVPFWFWKGPTKKQGPSVKDWQIVSNYHEINIYDMMLLCELFPQDVKSEIKRINLINKER